MMEDKSLKHQFIITFIKIIIISLILSTISFIIWFKTFDYIQYPANYYESQLPSIIHKINEKYEDVLDKSFEGEMNKIIPNEGILYQVLDNNGEKLYGDIEESLIKSKRELYENLNSVLNLENNMFARVIPVFDKHNNIKGAIILKYQLKSTQRVNNHLIFKLFNLIIFVPFVYIVIFTIVYSKKLTKNLTKPIDLLMEGSEKIKNKDLDFSINYKGNNERALILLEDMNKISNIENPNFILESTEINIIEFLKLKEKDYRLLCHEQGIEFKIDTMDLRKKNIIDKFDISSLEQVLDNIISNSIRYTERDGYIKLNTICKDDDIEFCIVDTGKGFSNEDLKKIFNKFYKGDKSRSFKTGHSGLGMYIAKNIVEKHGGNIKAENDNPKGAIIKFNIKPLRIVI